MADFRLTGKPANSRENTIMALAQAVRKDNTNSKEDIKDISKMWIDVNDRYPTDEECKRSNGSFLVCRSDGNLYIDKYLSQGNGYSPKGFYIKDTWEVVAWMNLPEPYVPEVKGTL